MNGLSCPQEAAAREPAAAWSCRRTIFRRFKCEQTRQGRYPGEIKHDGFRMMVRRDAAGVRLLTRNGRDWSARFPLIFEAAGALQVRSFLLDGEAVACDGDGMPVFDRLRYRRQDGRVVLYAFDLLEVNGQD